MRKVILLGLLGAGATASLLGTACGGSGKASSGMGGATTTTATTSTHTTTTSSSSATGGSPPASCASATPITVGTTQAGELSTTGQADYYSFTGTAGQALDIYTVAQGSTAGAAYDPTWIDTVVTLFDANDKQIAENNDSVPPRNNDSELITMLPADGTYCVRVEECWTWASNPASTCAGTADKTNTVYKVGVNLLDPTKPGQVQDQEDAGSTPTPVTYAKVVGSSGCYLSTAWGKQTGMTDVDTFSFLLPAYCAPSLPAGTRSLFSLYLLPTGPYGNGSTTPAGKVYLTAAAADAGQAPIAEISGADYQSYAQLWPPADLTQEYLFSIEHAPSAPGTNDFYVVLVGAGVSNYVETNEAGNDMLSGAETPPKSTQTTGTHYYADGDIVTDTDVDWWTVPVGTNTMVAVSCSSQRGGSGLRGFTMTVVDAANPTTMIASATESATSDAYTGYQPVGGATQLGVKMSTTMPHDPSVTSTFYHCGIHLQ
jgi:Bacterial pre-peptidase C-terminal domain